MSYQRIRQNQIRKYVIVLLIALLLLNHHYYIIHVETATFIQHRHQQQQKGTYPPLSKNAVLDKDRVLLLLLVTKPIHNCPSFLHNNNDDNNSHDYSNMNKLKHNNIRTLQSNDNMIILKQKQKLNNVNNNNTKVVRNIMNILMNEYDDYNITNWKRTRNYLYQSIKNNKVTLLNVIRIIQYLNETFLVTIPNHNHNNIQKMIIQTSPRILSRNIITQLQPTILFLKSLYNEEIFYNAIHRNPTLLLTSGTGYNDYSDLNLISIVLKQETTLNDNQINQLKRTSPFLFQLSTGRVLSFINYIQTILLQKSNHSHNHDHDHDDDNDQDEDDNDSSNYHDSDDNVVMSDTKIKTIIGKLIMNHPHLVQLSVTNNIQPRIEYIINECLLNTKDIANILIQYASILGLSIEDNLKPKIQLLKSLLVSKHNIRKVVVSHPSILGLSFNNIQTKIQFFNSIDDYDNNHINYDDFNNDNSSTIIKKQSSLVSRILLRSPAVFSLSLNDNIIPTIHYLSQIWGIDQLPSSLLQLSNTSTTNNSNNIESIQIKMPQMKDSRKKLLSLSSLLSEYPGILSLSLEGNIQPTIHFYNQTGYLSLHNNVNDKDDNDDDYHTTTANQQQQQNEMLISELKILSQNKPSPLIRGRYIAASLYNRLLPRWHYYHYYSNNNDNNIMMIPSSISNHNNISTQVEQEKSAVVEEKQRKNKQSTSSSLSTLIVNSFTNGSKNNLVTGISMKKPNIIPLHVLVTATDKEFCKLYQFDYDDYIQFKMNEIPRLKFRLQFDVWIQTGRPIDVVPFK